MMWRWLWAIWVCVAVTMALGGGCSVPSKEFATTAVQTISDLEKTGAKYDAELYLPTDGEVDWNPFGFKVRLPNGYLRVVIGTGRGSGPRAADVTDPSMGAGVVPVVPQ